MPDDSCTPSSFSRWEMAVDIEGGEMWTGSDASVILPHSPAAMKYSSWRRIYRITPATNACCSIQWGTCLSAGLVGQRGGEGKRRPPARNAKLPSSCFPQVTDCLTSVRPSRHSVRDIRIQLRCRGHRTPRGRPSGNSCLTRREGRSRDWRSCRRVEGWPGPGPPLRQA